MNKIEIFAGEHVPGDLVHGWPHIERVLFYAERVNRELKADRDIVRAACLLHDTGHSIGKEQHHLHSRVLAETLLARLEIGPETIKHIAECIAAHSRQYSPEPPASPEARVLYDADGMDLFGAVGLMRGLLSAAEGNRGFPAIIKKLEWRLSQVDNFYSTCARGFVKEHAPLIRQFLEQLKQQLQWFTKA